MKTLLNEYDGERWFPKGVDVYRHNLRLDMKVNDANVTKSNIAYNIQYLEFIEKEINELRIHIVIEKMLYKTYIITGMGIIESLFTNLLKSKGLWRVSEWKSIGILKSNEQKIDDKLLKVNTELYEKVEQFDERMDLDSMIKKIEKKNLLNIDHNVFPALKVLRDLRNKVHLQNREKFEESDYNCFNIEYKKMMGRVLYTILTADEFSTNTDTDIYNFFKCNF